MSRMSERLRTLMIFAKLRADDAGMPDQGDWRLIEQGLVAALGALAEEQAENDERIDSLADLAEEASYAVCEALDNLESAKQESGRAMARMREVSRKLRV